MFLIFEDNTVIVFCQDNTVRVPLIPAFFARMEFEMRQNRKIKLHWL